MTFLAGYRHDIFVSYAHGPLGPGFGGQSESKLGLWTRKLIDHLAEEILLSLGTKEVGRQCSIWMDPTLGGNQPLTETLKDKIAESALLVVVMSDFFLQSTWCLDEIEWFRQSCSRRGESASGRIFVVRAFVTDESSWPSGLRDSARHPLVGYRFHPLPADGLDKARPFGWDNQQATNIDYSTAMAKLVSDIGRQLKGFSAPKVLGPKISPKGHGRAERTVFLGFMHDTLDEERAEVRQRLSAAGIIVLPPESDGDSPDESDLASAIAKYLSQANAMVLIANEFRATWPKEQPGGFLSLQIQKAKEYQKRCDLWLQVDDSARVRKPEYRQYVDTLLQEAQQTGLPILHAGLDQFVEYVIEKLKSAVEPGVGVQTLDLGDAVICTNRPEDKALGEDFLETVKSTLSELNQESFTFDFSDPEEARIRLTNLEKRLRNASTVLVLCFDQNWDWARPFLRLLNGISHVKADGKVRLLVAGPRDRHEARYDARALGFSTLDGTDKDAEQLRELLRHAIGTSAFTAEDGAGERSRL